MTLDLPKSWAIPTSLLLVNILQMLTFASRRKKIKEDQNMHVSKDDYQITEDVS